MIVRTPFGADWDDLKLDHLTAFLAEPRDEGLTWEVKGGKIRPDHVRQAACGFANSHLGGFLILGATQAHRSGPWTLDGWVPPDEVTTWVSNCLANGGVDPLPSVDPQSWPLPDGGFLGCVAIWPVAVPPAVTAEGEVWLRTSGVTAQVKAAEVLRDLIGRGERARDRAHQISYDATRDLFSHPPEARANIVVVAGAAPAVPEEISALIFRKSLYDGLRARLEGPLDRAYGMPREFRLPLGGDLNQGSLTVWNFTGLNEGNGYSIRIGRHGGVAVGLADAEEKSGLDWVIAAPERLTLMWGVTVALLATLGARGPAHIATIMAEPRFGSIEVARWTDLEAPDAGLLDSVLREIRRAKGEAAWEPEG